jgi:hypothetical protein
MFSLALRKIRKNADSVCFCNYPCIYCIYWKRLHLCKIYRELTLWLNLYPNQMATSGRGGPNYLNPFFLYPIERSIDLKSKKRFFLSILLRNIQIDVYFRRDMNGKRSRWLHTHTQTHGHDIWFSYKVCGEREKGDEPLPAGFYIFLKLGSSNSSSTARLGEREGGLLCCPRMLPSPSSTNSPRFSS